MTIGGTVFGGQQPIVGAEMYMYAAASAPLVGGVFTAPAARSMLTTPGGYVTTGPGGNFDITSDYSCQTGDQVYLLAVGGNPGSDSDNPAITLAAPLGDCSKLSASTHIIVNEATTVAMAWALAPFMTSPTKLGSTGTTQGALGLANAFLTAGNIVNVASGTIPAKTVNGYGTLPQALMNSLADSLAACVNSDGSSTSPCHALFTAATPSGGTTPSDTFTAALNIVHHPGVNASAIYQVAGAAQPFQPTLSAAPHDWALAIDYNDSNGDYNSGYSAYGRTIAVDSQGRIWLRPEPGYTLISPLGAPTSLFKHPNTYNNPVAFFTVDNSDHLWFASKETSTNITVLNEGDTTGAVLMQPSLSVSHEDISLLAFDAAGNLWAGVGGYDGTGGGTIHVLNPSTGAQLASYSENYDANQVGSAYGYGLADVNGDMWVGTQLLSSTGSVLATNNSNAGNYCNSAAIFVSSYDRAGYLWGVNTNSSDSLYKCFGTGTAIQSYSYSGSGSSGVAFSFIDGDDHIWNTTAITSPQLAALNATDGSLFTPVYLESSGTAYDGGSSAAGLAGDPSGNLWIPADTGLREFVGVAAPTITPFAAAVKAGTLGTRP